jgi:hypothetical protein
LRKRVEAHIAVNNAQLDGFPLILSIVGDTGVGKTFNIRKITESARVETIELSSASLAHHKEGMALYPLIRHYRDCGMNDKVKSCLLLDDFDRSIASGFEKLGHTIHSQLIVGFLMDLCDNPYSVPDEERRVTVETRRVPIIMTGNDFTKLDPALTRPQRMTILHFAPSPRDKIDMVHAAFGNDNGNNTSFSRNDADELVQRFPREHIAFFSDIVSEHLLNACSDFPDSPLTVPVNELRNALARALIALKLQRALEIAEELLHRRQGNE